MLEQLDGLHELSHLILTIKLISIIDVVIMPILYTKKLSS